MHLDVTGCTTSVYMKKKCLKKFEILFQTKSNDSRVHIDINLIDIDFNSF